MSAGPLTLAERTELLDIYARDCLERCMMLSADNRFLIAYDVDQHNTDNFLKSCKAGTLMAIHDGSDNWDRIIHACAEHKRRKRSRAAVRAIKTEAWQV